MKKIMIATANAGKVKEFKHILEPLGYEVMSLLDLREAIDIEEKGTTFRENALIKARTIHEQFHVPVISDDSGLAVNHLEGRPGVYSARYLGKDTPYDVKDQHLIEELKDAKDRGCQYICDIAYVEADGSEHVFEGIMEGIIAQEQIGTGGFGYDPIFYYEPFKTTLANVCEEQKNKVSHRGLAVMKLLAYMEEK